MSVEEEEVVLARAQMPATRGKPVFVFSKHRNVWMYFYAMPCSGSNLLPRVSSFAVCLLTKVLYAPMVIANRG